MIDEKRKADDDRRWEALHRTCCYSPEVEEISICSETDRECVLHECFYAQQNGPDCEFLVLKDRCNACGVVYGN